jgi:sulfur carrier protein
MQVTINGESATFNKQTSVAELLNLQGITQQRLAIEINMEIVPRSEYHNHTITDGDAIEIVQAVGGG